MTPFETDKNQKHPQPAAARRGVGGRGHVDFFISYTEVDADSAEWIAKVLEDEGRYSTIFQAWDFRPGESFIQNMHLALQKSERVLAVISKRYLEASRFGEMEWQAALARDSAKVVPVRIEQVQLPGLLAPIAYIDLVNLDEATARRVLLDGLRKPNRREGEIPFPGMGVGEAIAPFMAPDPPAWAVERRAPLAKLREQIIPETDTDRADTNVSLVGAGGFGKTVLAALLCHDPVVRQRFSDGILWVTLGEQNVDVVAGLEKLHVALTGSRADFVDAEDASIRVAKALGDRQCLLVVDDVWDRAALEPFLRGGTRCVRVITTRLADVAEGTHVINIGSMDPSESLQLLTAEALFQPEAPGTFAPLIERLGGWALLVDLVGAALRREVARGADAAEAVSYLMQALDEEGVVAFDPTDTSQLRRAIAGTLGVSMRLLDSDERRRYHELAIFTPETSIPLAVIAPLWGLSEFAARRLATRLDDISLLQLELPARSVRLHTAVRAYLERQIDDPRGVHDRLVSSWGDPLRLPSEYAWRFIGHHLCAAGQAAALRSLLLSPPWLRAKLEVVGVAGLIADCRRFPDDATVGAVRGALQLSSDILARDPSQLGSHLFGRLKFSNSLEIRRLLDAVSDSAPEAWLRPLISNLAPPGGAVLRTVRHDDWIKALALTPDGRRVISASNRDVKIWDLDTGQELRTLQHSGLGESIAVLTERSLAVTEQDVACVIARSFFRVWSLEDGALIAGRRHVTAIAATPDLQILVTAGEDNTLSVEGRDNDEIVQLKGHTKRVTGLVISRDRQTVVSASDDRTIRVWNPADGSCRCTIAGHNDLSGAVAVTPDGRRVVGASGGNRLTVWDAETGRELIILSGHTSFITAVAIEDSVRALTSSGDRTIRLWDLESGKQLTLLTEHTQPVYAVAFHPDGRRALSGANDGTWRIWDLNAVPDPRPAGHGRYIGALTPTPDSKLLITGSGVGDLKIWDLPGGSERLTLEGHRGPITAVAVTLGGDVLASGSLDGTVRLWDLQTGACLHELAGHKDGVQALAVTRQGEVAAICGDFIGQRVRIIVWDLATGEQRRSWSQRVLYRPATNPRLAVTRDGSIALSNEGDGALRLWCFEDGNSLTVLEGNGAEVNDLAISSDGHRALTGAEDGAVRLWDLEKEQILAVLKGHSGPVRSLALVPGGGLAISGGQDRTLRVWDLEQAAELARYVGESPIVACACASDGRVFYCGDASGRPFALQFQRPGK